jgi:hypothetical protein
MTSLQTFISMFDTFLSELCETFPENKSFQTYYDKYDLLKSSNPRAVLNLFVEQVEPHAQYLYDKNDEIITQEQVPFLKELNFKVCWEAETTSNATKEAIWAHLTSLYFFATTIGKIPEGLMNNIEALAHEYAGQMGEADMSSMMNPEHMLKNMQSLLNCNPGAPTKKSRRIRN